MEDDGLTRLAVPVGPDDHARGPADAPVTLVEYGDFECPFCGIAYPAVKALEARYAGRVRLVFRSFPLQQHPHAEAAAEAAEFAADAGRFWEMHDTLFEHQRALAERDLLRYARELQLDDGALERALRDRTYAAIVEEQKESGEESGIPGTPAFFVNGVLFEDEPTEANLGHAIEYVLQHGGVV
ncbi:MAG TPA: thioredoxin domain-containing protein [Candidatus Elarobacter sp.]|nr:thioredoxin domain-containing protein [Candidatus Elarobacter sp.]